MHSSYIFIIFIKLSSHICTFGEPIINTKNSIDSTCMKKQIDYHNYNTRDHVWFTALPLAVIQMISLSECADSIKYLLHDITLTLYTLLFHRNNEQSHSLFNILWDKSDKKWLIFKHCPLSICSYHPYFKTNHQKLYLFS